MKNSLTRHWYRNPAPRNHMLSYVIGRYCILLAIFVSSKCRIRNGIFRLVADAPAPFVTVCALIQKATFQAIKLQYSLMPLGCWAWNHREAWINVLKQNLESKAHVSPLIANFFLVSWFFCLVPIKHLGHVKAAKSPEDGPPDSGVVRTSLSRFGLSQREEGSDFCLLLLVTLKQSQVTSLYSRP